MASFCASSVAIVVGLLIASVVSFALGWRASGHYHDTLIELARARGQARDRLKKQLDETRQELERERRI